MTFYGFFSVKTHNYQITNRRVLTVFKSGGNRSRGSVEDHKKFIKTVGSTQEQGWAEFHNFNPESILWISLHHFPFFPNPGFIPGNLEPQRWYLQHCVVQKAKILFRILKLEFFNSKISMEILWTFAYFRKHLQRRMNTFWTKVLIVSV